MSGGAQLPPGIVCAADLAATAIGCWPQFGTPVYFVDYYLRRRWPELCHEPDSTMDLGGISPYRLVGGPNIWIVTTYLRLRRKGLDVRVSDRLVPGHINVCYFDELLAQRDSDRAFLVVTQADRGWLGWGDYHLIQSPAQARMHRACLIDHWPQPNLVSRLGRRGTSVSRVGYLGWEGNLAPAFRSSGFARALSQLGVVLVVRSDPRDWGDYSDLDLCLAVRDTSRCWIETKPATKLVHSWLAGCPALLGNEPAYRYWGRPGEDYFEVNTPDEALAVVRQLKGNPELYRLVQARGAAKAKLHDEEAVCRQWVAVLAGPVMEAFSEWQKMPAWRKRTRRRWQRMAAPMGRAWFSLRARGLRHVGRAAKERIRRALRSGSKCSP